MNIGLWFQCAWIVVVTLMALVGLVSAQHAEKKGTCVLIAILVTSLVMQTALHIHRVTELQDLRSQLHKALDATNNEKTMCSNAKQAVLDVASNSIVLALETACKQPSKKMWGLM